MKLSCYLTLAIALFHGFFAIQPSAAQHSTTAKKFELPETLPNDPRKVRSKQSPKWLEAIGLMKTPIGKCSINLVVDDIKKDGIIAVTAAHCVKQWRKGKNRYEIGPHSVIFTANSGSQFTRSITSVLHVEHVPGGADFTIVKLDHSISKNKLKPLLNSPFDYADLLTEEIFRVSFEPFATMAGYSADKTLGKKGQVLTYHERCQLNGGSSGIKKGLCYSYEGASGGAVVVTVDLTALYEGEEDSTNPQFLRPQAYFVGTIVGRRSGDNYGKTMFTPTTHYTQIFDKILAAH